MYPMTKQFEAFQESVARAEQVETRKHVSNDTRLGSYIHVKTGLSFRTWFIGIGREKKDGGIGREKKDGIWEAVIEEVS